MPIKSALERLDPAILATSKALIQSQGFDFSTVSAAEMREMVKGMIRAEPFPVQGMANVRDATLDSSAGPLSIRIYTPTGKGPFPIVMYFHGGGWVAGDLDTQDTTCRLLCGYSGSVVVSVAYRLAPEHPFPAAIEDCYTATTWIARHPNFVNGEASRLAVSGESAGANLAAAVSLMARDRGGPAIRHQILMYGGFQWESWFAPPDYLGGGQNTSNPYLSPLSAQSLRALPPAVIVVGDQDPLMAQSIAYALRLCESGIETHYLCYPGMHHGFMSDPESEHCLAVIGKIASLLKAT